jgi:hypothetical protein
MDSQFTGRCRVTRTLYGRTSFRTQRLPDGVPEIILAVNAFCGKYFLKIFSLFNSSFFVSNDYQKSY